MMHGTMGRCARWCHNKSVGTLLLRLAFGAFLIGHGIAKLQNEALVGAFFASVGLETWWAPIVAWVELLSGIAFVLGAFVWPAAIAITVIQTVAIITVTSKVPGDALTAYISGWGPNLVYIAAALCIAFCGAGRYSLTAWYLRRKGMEGACKDCKAQHGAACDCAGCPDCSTDHSK